MAKTFLSIAGDAVCVLLSIATMYMFVATLLDLRSFEKSSAESGSGFHLLSCPKLFEKHATSSADIRSKYSDIRLNNESTEKLMAMLKDSLEHSRVLHAGVDAPNESRFLRNIAKAMEETIGDGREVDVNIPRRSDNRNLCDILAEIMDEQLDMQSDQQPDSEVPQITISILKVDHESNDSVFLRGARLIRNTPLIGGLLKMANLDDGVSDLVEKAKHIDLDSKFREAEKVS